MNKPYQNSPNIVLSQSDITDILSKLNSHVKQSADPAQALFQLLDYDDHFSFTLDDCRLALKKYK